ncbi:hypothetical protein FX988_03138 [Paraglaciecola mesophila]|uniref:Uncharacterized protein n=1 Tax=Paraglaciecola mesophila TaxID=197222 RepID=A0A857JP23_9ALTE|nr:hypothetical protein FX988_03138 [Paraglaciecola mesophila]
MLHTSNPIKNYMDTHGNDAYHNAFGDGVLGLDGL